MQHYISDSIYGLTLAWITSENSTKQLECRHLDSIFFAGPYLLLRCPESTAPVRVPSPTLSGPFSNQLSSRVPLPLPATPRFQVQNPLSGFAPKQTKESSAWRATYIVLQVRGPELVFRRFSGYFWKGLVTDFRSLFLERASEYEKTGTNLDYCYNVCRPLWQKISELDSIDLGRTMASTAMGKTLVEKDNWFFSP